MVGKKKLFLTIILLVGIEGHQTRNHYKKIPHINILDFIPIEFQGIIFLLALSLLRGSELT